MIRIAATIIVVYLTIPIAGVAAQEIWTCTYPGFSQGRRPVIVRYRQEGELLMEDKWKEQYQICKTISSASLRFGPSPRSRGATRSPQLALGPSSSTRAVVSSCSQAPTSEGPPRKLVETASAGNPIRCSKPSNYWAVDAIADFNDPEHWRQQADEAPRSWKQAEGACFILHALQAACADHRSD
jgi:hypothetical protein